MRCLPRPAIIVQETLGSEVVDEELEAGSGGCNAQVESERVAAPQEVVGIQNHQVLCEYGGSEE